LPPDARLDVNCRLFRPYLASAGWHGPAKGKT